MPYTPNAGLPYPAPTDAPNVPLHLQQLAEAVDARIAGHVRKTADQSVSSATTGTTFVDDTHLKVTLDPGTYRVQALLAVVGAATADIKTTWTFSGTISSSATSRFVLGPEIASASPAASMVAISSATITSVATYGTNTTVGMITEDLHLVVTAAGTLTFRWAQSTANATATTVQANSRLYWQRVA